MKFLIILLILFNTPSVEKTYCDGWKKGYKAGYCYEVINCITPVIPVCPIPKINETSFQDGYNRGFLKGKKDK